MKNTTKRWLIAATSLVLGGCVLFGGAMSMLKWDFSKLSTVQYVTNEYDITEAFSDITIDTNTADVVLVPSEDERVSVVCHEVKNVTHTVKVQDGALFIQLVDTRKWYEHINFNIGTPCITVSLPKGVYGALSIQSSTSDVEIAKDFAFESMYISQTTGDIVNHASASGAVSLKTTTGNIVTENAAGSLKLHTTTGGITLSNITCAADIECHIGSGDVTVSDVTCRDFRFNGNTSDASLTNVVVAETMSLQCTTGDVTFAACDAAEVFVKTTTGNVTGSLLTDKVFVAKTTTGNVNVPNTAVGGKCEITTVTGDIEIAVP